MTDASGRRPVTAITGRRPYDVIRRLHIAGVDIILDRAGTPHLIEVNDRPVRLSEIRCDWSGHGQGADAAAALAYSMVVDGKSKSTTVVVPSAFAITGVTSPLRQPVSWRLAGRSAHPDDLRVSASLADLTSFTNATVSTGTEVHVVTATTGALGLPHDAADGVVWNRSQAPLADAPRVVNDHRAAAFCIDKLATRRVFADGQRSALAPTDGSDPALDLTDDPLLVLKPRFGSASRDVYRGRWHELQEYLAADSAEQPFVIEHWLDGATLADDGHRFRFDLRIVVIGGVAVAAVVRRAAAPAIGRFEDSPLCWLTTSGPLLAVALSSGADPVVSAGVAQLPEAWVVRAAVLAERAVTAIEQELTDTAGQLAPVVPDFLSLHQISGPLVPIPITADPLTTRGKTPASD